MTAADELIEIDLIELDITIDVEERRRRNHNAYRVVVKAPAGFTARFRVHPQERVETLTRHAIKHFTHRGQLGDAVSGHNRIAAVFAESDLWGSERLHLDEFSRQPNRPSSAVNCSCGYQGEVRGYPHDDCDQPFCPRCGECGCDRKFASHHVCTSCGVTTTPNDLVGGVCSMCR